MPEQPTPHAGHQSVTRSLIDLLSERERKGIATYGRSLETFNGRSAPQDLIEELLDAVQYARQWQMERAKLIEVVKSAIEWREANREVRISDLWTNDIALIKVIDELGDIQL